MPHYIKFAPDGSPLGHETTALAKDGYNTAEGSAANGKPYFREAEIVDPTFDPVTQTRTGPVYEASPARIVFTVTDKSQADLIALRKKEADAEADRRLITQYPVLDQIWGASRGVALLKKKAIDGQDLTAGENTTLNAILAAVTWIDGLRAKRQTLKTSIDGMSVAQLKGLNVSDESHWA